MYAGTLIAGFHIGRGESQFGPSAVAQASFEKALVHNWGEGDNAVETITVALDPYYPNGPLISKRVSLGRGTRTVNLPVVREVLLSLSSSYELLRWAIRNDSGSVLLAFHYPPVSAPILGLCRVLNIPAIVILTDLPLFSYSSARVRKMPIWKRFIMLGYRSFAEWLIKRYDGYVLFSRHMSKLVNPRAKPEAVVEGIFNPASLALAPNRPTRRKGVIAHAGTLNREYGIENLLDAFSLVRDPEAQLWLFGAGDMDYEIEQRSINDSRIKHFGFRPRDEVFAKLAEATLLVVTRDPSAEFTKYSFPSKLFEYLATGTPVACTELAGIPAEYFEYILRLEYASSESMAAQLGCVLGMDADDLDNRGRSGQRFVLEAKGPDVQVGRIKMFVHSVARRFYKVEG